VRELMAAAQEVGLPLIARWPRAAVAGAGKRARASCRDPDTFKPRADYLLEVRGMSMRDAGILDGDWLAVHKRAQAQSADRRRAPR